MPRIKNCITITAGAAAGLFLAGLASSASAAADTATPVSPSLPGLVQQVINAPASIPQQLLENTATLLTGTPAAQPAPAPIATATLNMPQTPAAGSPAGASGIPGLPLPGNLSSLLPFPLPNLGGTTSTAAVPSATLPGLFMPSATAGIPGQAAAGSLPLISGLP